MNPRAACRSLLAASLLALAAGPAAAATLVFGATLNGASESPPVVSSGTGTAIVTFNTDNPLSPIMRVQATFSGLTGTVTIAHIHCCTANPFAGTVGVATPTPSFPLFPSGVTSGTYDELFDMSAAASWNAPFINNNGGTPLDAFDALLAGIQAGRAYFNIHSSFSSSGEIRGFLEPIPEPGTYALMALGLAIVGWMGRRRMQPGHAAAR